MTRFRSTARRTAELAQFIARDWPDYEATLAGLLAATTRADGRTAGVSDSTLQQVMARAKWDTEWQYATDALERATLTLEAIAVAMTELRREAGNTSAPQCTGGLGMAGYNDWGRDCEAFSVTNSGLCSACDQRRRYWTTERTGRATTG